VLLLTKADALGDAPGALAAIEHAVYQACPAATIVVSHPSRAPLRRLLGIDAFRRRQVRISPELEDAGSHSLGAQTVCLRVHGALPLEALQRWLQHVISTHEPELYRLKGTLAICEDARRFVVQGVHGEVRGHFDDAAPAPTAAAGGASGRTGDSVGDAADDDESVLVLIAATGPPPDYAYCLDELELQTSLQACAAEDEPSRVAIVRSGTTKRRAPPAKDDDCRECS